MKPAVLGKNPKELMVNLIPTNLSHLNFTQKSSMGFVKEKQPAQRASSISPPKNEEASPSKPLKQNKKDQEERSSRNESRGAREFTIRRLGPNVPPAVLPVLLQVSRPIQIQSRSLNFSVEDQRPVTISNSLSGNLYLVQFNSWKKKNNFPQNAKVFILAKEYPAFREAFKRRGGWVENPNQTSEFFDFCYSPKVRFKKQSTPLQMSNHMKGVGSLTGKRKLMYTLKEVIWQDSVDLDEFWPRCYDLSDATSTMEFKLEFKLRKAESILKRFKSQPSPDNYLKAHVALHVLQRKLTNESTDTNIDVTEPKISELEWRLLSRWDKIYETYTEWAKSEKVHIEKSKKIPKDFESAVDLFLLNYQSNQDYLTGNQNLWILKPGALSRGRGIQVFDSLDEIEKKLRAERRLDGWVIQKYIEAPLVVLGKKLDIRQWVLVSRLNPLTVYFYEECYIRFSAEAYDPRNIKNNFIHLTNNSIAAKSDKFNSSEIKGNMWTSWQMRQYIINTYGEDHWEAKIKPQMKSIARCSLKAALEQILAKSKDQGCTFELLGFDYMVDQQFNVWLIEINRSPCLDWSTEVTAELVKMASEDLVKVIVDKGEDKGKFTLILEMPLISEEVYNNEMEVAGKHISSLQIKKMLKP